MERFVQKIEKFVTKSIKALHRNFYLQIWKLALQIADYSASIEYDQNKFYENLVIFGYFFQVQVF